MCGVLKIIKLHFALNIKVKSPIMADINTADLQIAEV